MIFISAASLRTYPKPMWKRFTPSAREAFQRAQRIAGNVDVAPVHLLAALLADPERPEARILSALGATMPGMPVAVEAGGPPFEQHLAQGTHRAVERAYREAAEAGTAEIGTAHLLVGLLLETDCAVRLGICGERGEVIDRVWRELASSEDGS